MKNRLKDFKNRLWGFVNSHRIITLIIVSLAAVLIAGGLTYLGYINKPTKSSYSSYASEELATTTKPTIYYSPLTGLKVDYEAITKQQVTALMIGNSTAARPQSGLKESGVVFEAIAEGGITRFLALYQEQKPELVGPIRSVRIYYVDWLAPFDASVGHVGGSALALAEIRNGSYKDIDQFFNGGSYWRSTDRYAPHNVYTSFSRLDSLNNQKGFVQSNFKPFSRIDSEAAPITTVSNIDVTMSGALYNSSYTYDKTSNTYLRYQAGQPHQDREKGQISPRVVIVMKSAMSSVMEDGYRESYATTGSGKAYIFQDGGVIEGNWNKQSRKEQLYFTDSEGKEISLARGQTFISVVPEATGGVSWR